MCRLQAHKDEKPGRSPDYCYQVTQGESRTRALRPRPRRVGSLRSVPSSLRSLLASSPTAVLLALATALTPGFEPRLLLPGCLRNACHASGGRTPRNGRRTLRRRSPRHGRRTMRSHAVDRSVLQLHAFCPSRRRILGGRRVYGGFSTDVSPEPDEPLCIRVLKPCGVCEDCACVACVNCGHDTCQPESPISHAW